MDSEFGDVMEIIQSRWMAEKFMLAGKEVENLDDLLRSANSLLKSKRLPARQRKKSKIKSSRKKAYTDERGVRFEFSLFAQDGADPKGKREAAHGINCRINGYFRLGCRINSAHHYDATDPKRGRMDGKKAFQCHGAESDVIGGKRSNIWSNDFRIDKQD